MLSFKDLQRLEHKDRSHLHFRCPGGTALHVVGLPTYHHIRTGVKVWFDSFNSFSTADGVQKLSHYEGFGRVGGADSWDDFTPVGKQWIKENYDATRCLLGINTEYDYFGIRACYLRLGH